MSNFLNSSSSVYYSFQREYIDAMRNLMEDILWIYSKLTKIKRDGMSDSETYDLLVTQCRQRYILGTADIAKKKSNNIKWTYDDLCNKFKLSDIESFCFMLSLMTINCDRCKKLFANINNDSRKTYPTYELAISIFHLIYQDKKYRVTLEQEIYLRKKLSCLMFYTEDNNGFILSNVIYTYITTENRKFSNIDAIEIYNPSDSSPLPIMEDISDTMGNITKNPSVKPPIYFYLTGANYSGKKTQVRRFADKHSLSVVILNLKAIYDDLQVVKNILEDACRIAIIINGAICIDNIDIFQNIDNKSMSMLKLIIERTGYYVDFIFLLAQQEQESLYLDFKYDKTWFNIDMRLPTIEESVLIWKEGLKNLDVEENVTAIDMANKFIYTPGQIINTIQEAKLLLIKNNGNTLTKKELNACAYNQSSHDLRKNADIVHVKYDWNTLILPDREKELMRNACSQFKYKHIVYHKWGMNKRIPYGRGISMLFYGLPGTGKTMAAQVVANELDLEMYRVNLSQVVSKYIGETEKNLGVLFEEARKTNVILFFDEADAIFGKRTEVKDSHDKNANLETSFLLQKMEEYEGITILTTNYLENIDSAFHRRISYIIHFPFPDVSSRKMIWQNMFVDEMPKEDIDFDYLAKNFELAGGNIKNIVVSAAFMAVQENSVVNMGHIVRSIKYEMSKMGKHISKEEFGEYKFYIE